MRNPGPEPRPPQGGERGSSLIEVLVALLIFLFLMLGVLQMFGLAFITANAAGARTEMTYKAQQLIENMRYLNSLYKSNPTAIPSDLSTWFPLSDGATYDLSTMSATDLAASYWGPGKTDVVESVNPRYALTMSVQDGGGYWNLTVTAKANTAAGVNPYIGGVGQRKVVEYVAQLAK